MSAHFVLVLLLNGEREDQSFLPRISPPPTKKKKKKKQLKKLTTLKETLEEGEINNRYLIIWVTILAATNKRLREDFGHLKKMKSSSDISLHTAMDVGVRFLRKLVRTCLSLAISLSKLCFLFYLFISPGN
jgi:hypothetical protein